MQWYSYCSAFLLKEKYQLSTIDLKENDHPELAKLRLDWLDFCKEHKAPVPASRLAMMALSTVIHNSLLEHVSSFQLSQSDAVDTGTTGDEVIEEDGVYYRFGGGALCEMLHHWYNQICNSTSKNLMSIEISLLQAINTKDTWLFEVSGLWIHVLSSQSVYSIFATGWCEHEASHKSDKL